MRILRKSSYFLLLLAVVATAKSAYANKADDEIACPGQSFPEFFSAFADSEAVQRAFVKLPLRMVWLDLDAEPEPKPAVKNLRYPKIIFPLIPLRTEREKDSLSLRVDYWSKRKAKATLFKNGTDYKVTYFFRNNRCWRLTSIENQSL